MTWNRTTWAAVATVMAMMTTTAQAQPFVYALTKGSSGAQSLFVFNGSTHARVAQIPLGVGRNDFWDDGGFVMSSDGERIYVSNKSDGSISVVSTTSNTVIDTLPRALLFPSCLSGCGATSLALSLDGRKLYVDGGTVIDLTTRTRQNYVNILALDSVTSPDGSRLYVRTPPGANGPQDIEVYNASALATATTKAAALLATVAFPVGVDDRGVVLDISADGRFLYAPRSHGVGDYGVAIVDTTTNTFVTETPTPAAYASSTASNGTTAYVTGRDSADVLYRLSPTTHQPLGTTGGMSASRDVAFSSDGSRAYVARGVTVLAIDTATHAVVRQYFTGADTVAVVVKGAYTVATGIPGAPGNVRATVNGNTISLNWNAPTTGASPTGYTLVGRLVAGGPVVGSIGAGAGSSFSIPVPNGTYVLSLTATNASGTGPESAAVTVTAPQPVLAPGAPSTLTASVSGATASFAWGVPTSGGPVQSYVLVAGLTPAFSVPYTTVPLGAATSFSVSGVPPGTYYVRVHAQNTGGTSPSSNEVALTVAGATAPGAPTLNPPSVTGSTVSLSWAPGSGDAPTSYTLSASVSPGGAPIVVVPLSGTSVTFPGVPAGTYYLRLTAVNAAGSSPPSAETALVVP